MGGLAIIVGPLRLLKNSIFFVIFLQLHVVVKKIREAYYDIAKLLQ